MKLDIVDLNKGEAKINYILLMVERHSQRGETSISFDESFNDYVVYRLTRLGFEFKLDESYHTVSW